MNMTSPFSRKSTNNHTNDPPLYPPPKLLQLPSQSPLPASSSFPSLPRLRQRGNLTGGNGHTSTKVVRAPQKPYRIPFVHEALTSQGKEEAKRAPREPRPLRMEASPTRPNLTLKRGSQAPRSD